MQRHLYVFGNGNLSFAEFLRVYAAPLETLNPSDRDLHFIVCDFRGVDTLAMEFLKCITGRVSVYHIGERPRYLPDKYRTRVSQWQLRGGYATDGERDAAAIAACTHFLACDANSSATRRSGTSANIDRCIELGKVRVTNKLSDFG